MTPSLTDLATTERLLVISDFDGTIADLSTNKYAVPINQDSVAAINRLAALPSTQAAVLSGRHLEGLAKVLSLREPVIVAGSHGSESLEHGVLLTAEMREQLTYVEDQLAPIMASYPLAHVEDKPFQRVAHVAELAAIDPAAAAELLERVSAIDPRGARMTTGKNIIEFSVSDATKGTWISAEVARQQPTRTVFLGDDTTDEDGFLALGPDDLGVKVGDGATAAALRLADTAAVGDFLTQLADARAAHTGLPRGVAARFDAIVASFTGEVLRTHDWNAPTPCDKWAARDLVSHLIIWYSDFLQEEGIDLNLHADPEEPQTAWLDFIAAVRPLLASPELTDAIARRTTGFLLPDIFIHTWDLARSQGHEVQLDEHYAARNLEGLRSMGASLQANGRFGPPRPVDEEAGAVEKLVAFAGRDPKFGRPLSR